MSEGERVMKKEVPHTPWFVQAEAGWVAVMGKDPDSGADVEIFVMMHDSEEEEGQALRVAAFICDTVNGRTARDLQEQRMQIKLLRMAHTHTLKAYSSMQGQLAERDKEIIAMKKKLSTPTH